MTVTVRLTEQRARELATLTERCDRTAVWIATQALLYAAHSSTTTPKPLEAHLGRQKNTTHRSLIALRGASLDIADGLAAAHIADDGRIPSRHEIVRAALAHLVDEFDGADAAAAHLGGYGADDADRKPEGRGAA